MRPLTTIGLHWLVLAVMAVSAEARADEPARTVPEAVATRFARLDRDGDKALIFEEYKSATAPAQAALALRDFKLFDRDANGQLSLEEFWSMSPISPPDQRGPLSDPMTALVDQFVAILDQTFGNWDKQPNRTVAAAEFLSGFADTLQEPLTPQMHGQADPDGDRKVTRAEARRFVEIQAGVRRGDGQLLREPSGRVCHYIQFQLADRNGDDRLDLAELHTYAGEKDAAATFTRGNTDLDEYLSWDEWRRIRMHDPIYEFRRMDTNLDGQLDPQELLTGTPEWIKISAKVAFPAFDTDKSGALSLDEYRLTMQSNPVAKWNTVIVDDGDGRISRAEFRYLGAVPVLRCAYFSLLDANGDGALDPQEFVFKRKIPREFYTLSADGSGWRKLFDVPGFPSLGSPAVSPDGKRIAFDAHGAKQATSDQVLLVADLDGGNLVNLGPGMMPTWSPDGRQLAYSWQGLRILDLATKQSQPLGNAWGAQWSPDGKRVACYSGQVLMTIDVASRQSTAILNAADHSYRELFWNMTWSPDSRRICFKATRIDGTEHVATVEADPQQPRLKVHHSGKGIAADFAWRPDGSRIVFSMHCPERGLPQLYQFDPDTDDPPALFEGQDPKTANAGLCWTPDGKQLIVIAGDY